jgi:cysteinyl-tRNA synthetase
MSSKYLGLPFDIHGGGMDLRFPHHENEIAQAEAATGKEFAKYWMHIGLLTVDGEKMSKSIGNIVNIKDLIKKWDPEVVRFFYAQAHYRSPPDFSENALKNAKKGIERIYRAKEKLEKCANQEKKGGKNKKYQEQIEKFKSDFESAMDDDFNTPQAVSIIFEFVNDTNKFFEEVENPDSGLCKKAFDTFVKLGNILTLFQDKKDDISKDSDLLEQIKIFSKDFVTDVKGKTIEELIDILLEAREKARSKKDWSTSDKIRNKLKDLGFEIQDTDSGPVWRKK